MHRARMLIALTVASAAMLTIASNASAAYLGVCAEFSNTVVRGIDSEAYVNASCDDGQGHSRNISGFDLAPGSPTPPTGWTPSFSSTPNAQDTNFFMDINSAASGEATYRVHLSFTDTAETLTFNTADIDVTFIVQSESDLGVENLAHAGSTTAGEIGTYSVDLRNAGPSSANDVTYKLTIQDPAAQILIAPSECDPAINGGSVIEIECHLPLLTTGTEPRVFQVRNGPTSGNAMATISAPYVSDVDEDEGGLPSSTTLLLGLTPASSSTPPPSAPGPGTGPAQAPKTSVKAKIASKVKGSVKGKSVKFSISPTFAIPSGLTSAQTCSGKIKAQLKPKGVKKTIKVYGSLKASDTMCKAKLKFTLPKKFKSKKIKIKFAFAGNASVEAFSKSVKIKIK